MVNSYTNVCPLIILILFFPLKTTKKILFPEISHSIQANWSKPRSRILLLHCGLCYFKDLNLYFLPSYFYLLQSSFCAFCKTLDRIHLQPSAVLDKSCPTLIFLELWASSECIRSFIHSFMGHFALSMGPPPQHHALCSPCNESSSILRLPRVLGLC